MVFNSTFGGVCFDSSTYSNIIISVGIDVDDRVLHILMSIALIFISSFECEIDPSVAMESSSMHSGLCWSDIMCNAVGFNCCGVSNPLLENPECLHYHLHHQ